MIDWRTEALKLEWESSDLGKITVREYLKKLLGTLIAKGEDFSGKHPFGNSGWQNDLATPLIEAGLIGGESTDYDYIEGVDWEAFDQVMKDIIELL